MDDRPARHVAAAGEGSEDRARLSRSHLPAARAGGPRRLAEPVRAALSALSHFGSGWLPATLGRVLASRRGDSNKNKKIGIGRNDGQHRGGISWLRQSRALSATRWTMRKSHRCISRSSRSSPRDISSTSSTLIVLGSLIPDMLADQVRDRTRGRMDRQRDGFRHVHRRRRPGPVQRPVGPQDHLPVQSAAVRHLHDPRRVRADGLVAGRGAFHRRHRPRRRTAARLRLRRRIFAQGDPRPHPRDRAFHRRRLRLADRARCSRCSSAIRSAGAACGSSSASAR